MNKVNIYIFEREKIWFETQFPENVDAKNVIESGMKSWKDEKESLLKLYDEHVLNKSAFKEHNNHVLYQIKVCKLVFVNAEKYSKNIHKYIHIVFVVQTFSNYKILVKLKGWESEIDKVHKKKGWCSHPRSFAFQ